MTHVAEREREREGKRFFFLKVLKGGLWSFFFFRKWWKVVQIREGGGVRVDQVLFQMWRCVFCLFCFSFAPLSLLGSSESAWWM